MIDRHLEFARALIATSFAMHNRARTMLPPAMGKLALVVELPSHPVASCEQARAVAVTVAPPSRQRAVSR